MSRLPYWLLLIVVALAPLPFGANRPWSWSFLSLVVGILLILWVLSALRDPGKVRAAWRHHWLATCLFFCANQRPYTLRLSHYGNLCSHSSGHPWRSEGCTADCPGHCC